MIMDSLEEAYPSSLPSDGPHVTEAPQVLAAYDHHGQHAAEHDQRLQHIRVYHCLHTALTANV